MHPFVVLMLLREKLAPDRQNTPEGEVFFLKIAGHFGQSSISQVFLFQVEEQNLVKKGLLSIK